MLAEPFKQGWDPAHSLAAPVTPLALDSVAVLVTSLATRLNRGATGYYQHHFAIGMAEFRIVMALGLAKGLNIGEVAMSAEVDKAAASRALRNLQRRGLVQLEQTVSRGRAAIVHLTPEGQVLESAIRKAAHRREKKLTAVLSPKELELTMVVLHKLIGGVHDMNKE
jgi:DNA-binding MarR family transcriptional regulator